MKRDDRPGTRSTTSTEIGRNDTPPQQQHLRVEGRAVPILRHLVPGGVT
jgi:hypothetical protein